MQQIEKDMLKNEISIMLKGVKIEANTLKKLKTKDLAEFIDFKVLQLSHEVLKWAFGKQIISENTLKPDNFTSFKDDPINKHALGGAVGVGAAGAGAAFNVAAAPGFLGFGGGVAAIGLGGAAAIVAPIVAAGVGFMGIKKYNQKKKMLNQLVEHFENEKKKILKFYLETIDNLK